MNAELVLTSKWLCTQSVKALEVKKIIIALHHTTLVRNLIFETMDRLAYLS